MLTKSDDFTGEPNLKDSYGKPFRIIYTGNIGSNRYKSLSIIAKALSELNDKEPIAEMEIYTATPLTKRMQKALNVKSASKIVGKVSSKEVKKLQSEADILVHVEAMDLKNRLLVRQSFSTKLVDYFKCARPILAVGPKTVASLSHLIENDCAMVCSSIEEVKTAIKKAVEDKNYLTKLSLKAYECGAKNHNRNVMQKEFIQDLEKIYKESNREGFAN